MAITEQEIKNLAKLAKLNFSEDEMQSFAGEFEEIIEFANGINASVSGDTSTIREVVARTVRWEDLRGDEVVESLPNEKVTSNVRAENGYFPVKRVVK